MSDMKTRILVVDDDAALRDLLTGYLEKQGFEVAEAEDGREMDACLARQEADLIILDLMLPGDDGLTLARRLRERSQIPIIMLSARGDEVDRIVGLEVGADDYLPKPFNPRELLARIRAVLRRPACPAEQEQSRRFLFGPYRLDVLNRQLYRDDEPLPLTGGEFDLLLILVENPNRVLDRDHLLDLQKGYERSPFDRSIDVQIARLRAKVEPDTKHPRYIRTVWGKGYIFTPQGET